MNPQRKEQIPLPYPPVSTNRKPIGAEYESIVSITAMKSQKISKQFDQTLPKVVEENQQAFLSDRCTQLRKRNELIKDKLRRCFETKAMHVAILIMVVIDVSIVIVEIVGENLGPHSHHHEEESELMQFLSMTSLMIAILFMIELMVSLYAFGLRRFYKDEGWQLYLLDAVIIITSFCIDVFLKGSIRDISELIVILRLWRVVRLVSTVVVEYGHYEEARIHELQENIVQLQAYNIKLQELITAHGIPMPTMSTCATPNSTVSLRQLQTIK